MLWMLWIFSLDALDLCSGCFGSMLWTLRIYALDALDALDLCFGCFGSMLWMFRLYALDASDLCFARFRSLLCTLQDLCFGCFGSMPWMLQPSAWDALDLCFGCFGSMQLIGAQEFAAHWSTGICSSLEHRNLQLIGAMELIEFAINEESLLDSSLELWNMRICSFWSSGTIANFHQHQQQQQTNQI
jgi:hypothetical protein